MNKLTTKILTRGKGYKVSSFNFNGKKIKVVRQAVQGKLQ